MCKTFKLFLNRKICRTVRLVEIRGGARIFRQGADSSDEGAKIWFSGYYKCQKSPKKSLFTFRRGASMLQLGAIAP